MILRSAESYMTDLLNEPNGVTYLCGAGISYPSPTMLPTVETFIETCVKHCEPEGDVLGPMQAKLQKSNVPLRFEMLIEAIRKVMDPDLSVGAVFNSDKFNTIHQFLADQCFRGAAIVTTNFDNCIENCLIQPYQRIVFDGQDLDTMPSRSHVLVKPHGSNTLAEDMADSGLVISVRGLAQTAKGFQQFPQWKNYLSSLFHNRMVVVLGYSGSDDFDITPILVESKPKVVLWFEYNTVQTLPVAIESSDANANVQRIADSVNVKCFTGVFQTLIEETNGAVITQTKEDFIHSLHNVGTSLDAWLRQTCFSDDLKTQLLGTLILHYALPELLLECIPFPQTAGTRVLVARSQFYLGRHQAVLKTLATFDSSTASTHQSADAAFIESASRSYLGQMDEAIAAGKKYHMLSKELDDTFIQISALNNLGGILCFAHEYAESQQVFESALQLVHSHSSLEGEASAHWGLASIAGVYGNWEDAHSRFLMAREIYLQLGGRIPVARIDQNIGQALLNLTRFKEARNVLRNAESVFLEATWVDGLIFVYIDLAKIEFLEANSDFAVQHCTKVVELLNNNSGHPALPSLINLSFLLGGRGCHAKFLKQLIEKFGLPYSESLQQTVSPYKDPTVLFALEVIQTNGQYNQELYDRIKAHLFPFTQKTPR